MEYNEEELDNVVGGVPREIAETLALDNDELFRGKSIEDLKRLRDELKPAENELTQEELDQVMAGRNI